MMLWRPIWAACLGAPGRSLWLCWDDSLGLMYLFQRDAFEKGPPFLARKHEIEKLAEFISHLASGCDAIDQSMFEKKLSCLESLW